MHPVIGRCPICHDELSVARLHCHNCGTQIEGDFSLGPLQRLNQDQVRFVEAFVRNRGSLKDVGSELGMSYPTVNNRLNDILIAMGYGDRVKVPEPAEPATEGGQVNPARKREILTAVREGRMSALEAERLLRGAS
jgi:hypothetical protein